MRADLRHLAAQESFFSLLPFLAPGLPAPYPSARIPKAAEAASAPTPARGTAEVVRILGSDKTKPFQAPGEGTRVLLASTRCQAEDTEFDQTCWT